jgi:hypothetical protein
LLFFLYATDIILSNKQEKLPFIYPLCPKRLWVLGSPKPGIKGHDGSSWLQMKGVCVLVSTPSGLCAFIMKHKRAENLEFSSAKFANLVT